MSSIRLAAFWRQAARPDKASFWLCVRLHHPVRLRARFHRKCVSGLLRHSVARATGSASRRQGVQPNEGRGVKARYAHHQPLRALGESSYVCGVGRLRATGSASRQSWVNYCDNGTGDDMIGDVEHESLNLFILLNSARCQ